MEIAKKKKICSIFLFFPVDVGHFDLEDISIFNVGAFVILRVQNVNNSGAWTNSFTPYF